MGHVYKGVQWTPYKKRFDLVLAIGIFAFLAAFVAAAVAGPPPGETASAAQVVLRALGACAFALLTLILSIGPLARISPRFLPLLYNRRHLGVACFVLALTHALIVIFWYHGFAKENPLVSLLASNPRYDSIGGFPFESLGLAALLIMFVMAATSHDFWNANLGPGFWKALHMSVYPAYALIVAHIALGALQNDRTAIYPFAVGLAAFLVAALHLASGVREARRDAAVAKPSLEGWISVGPALDIPDKRARIVVPERGERIAVFRDGHKIHALSNRCRHQGGPLGEGRIVEGCVTCPWHGFQYRPEDGRSPPPFTEKVATYRTRVVNGIVYVDPNPLPAGAPVAPSLLEAAP